MELLYQLVKRPERPVGLLPRAVYAPDELRSAVRTEPMSNRRSGRLSAMENQEWQETVAALVDAKRCLATAWQILDGTDGAASGVEHALNAALASIDAIYAIEHENVFNADVASPVDVEEFWRRHGELPGFAAGT